MKVKEEKKVRYHVSRNMECEVEIINKQEKHVSINKTEFEQLEPILSSIFEEFYRSELSILKSYDPHEEEFKLLIGMLFDKSTFEPDDYMGIYVRVNLSNVEFELEFDPDIPSYQEFSSIKTIIELTKSQHDYLKLLWR